MHISVPDTPHLKSGHFLLFYYWAIIVLSEFVISEVRGKKKIRLMEVTKT